MTQYLSRFSTQNFIDNLSKEKDKLLSLKGEFFKKKSSQTPFFDILFIFIVFQYVTNIRFSFAQFFRLPFGYLPYGMFQF